MNNNPVLDKNLACVSKYNPNLKYKIMRINALNNDITFVNTLLQEPNMMYNGVYLHDNYGAEAQAREIFEKAENNTLSIHVIYGFGLGYLFKEFADKSNGTVLLYEPNIEILASVLEVVDFSEELSKNNVYIFNDFDLLKKYYIKNCKINSKTSITVLPSYRKIFEKDLSEFINKTNFLMGALIIDNNYIRKKMVPAVKMVCNNIDSLIKEIPLNEYKNLYEGKTALIVSAGPSLDRDIEIIRKYRDNVIIFSVGQALRTLMKNGIKPDFISMVETCNQMSQIEDLDVTDIDLILEPLTCDCLHKTKFRNIFLYPSHTSVPNLIWTNIANIDATEYFSSGTVSYVLLYSAKILGFKNIVLSGQDLAFLDGKCYTKEARNTGLTFDYDEQTGKVNVSVEDFKVFAESFFEKNSKLTEEQKFDIAQRRLERIKNNLYFVKGITGKMIPTTNDYASFIIEFENFAQKNKETINLYNTSLYGAKINGFEDIGIEEILKQQAPVSRKYFETDFKYNIPSIINNIKLEIKHNSEILKMLNSANFLTSNFDKEYSNRKVLNENCIKYFKQLMTLYIDLKETYCNKSKIFLYLNKAYSMDIDAILQESTTATVESIQTLYYLLKSYITQIETDLEEINKTLNIKVKEINEMFNTKS